MGGSHQRAAALRAPVQRSGGSLWRARRARVAVVGWPRFAGELQTLNDSDTRTVRPSPRIRALSRTRAAGHDHAPTLGRVDAAGRARALHVLVEAGFEKEAAADLLGWD